MEYLMVGFALLGLTVKGYCGKKISGFVQTPVDAVGWNLIHMLFCMLIGACLFFFEQAQGFLLVEPGMLAICFLSGLANATFLVLWVFAVQKNTMVFVDVGLTMGSMIPAVLCAFLFREVISIPKLLGFALILLATVVLAGPHGHLGRVELSGISLVGLAAIADGLSGFAQQLYRQYYTFWLQLAISWRSQHLDAKLPALIAFSRILLRGGATCA